MDDPSNIPIYIFVLIALILLSAFFSATETAFSSLNKTRLKLMTEDGKKSAVLAYKLSEKYDNLLFTILIGNNIVNITAATISTLLFSLLITTSSISATVSTVVVTVTILVFGEITPKTIAKEVPEKFACFSAYIINFFFYVLYPVNLIFRGWKWILRKVFKLKGGNVITEDELLTYVEEANEDGTLDKNETELISSAIEFNDSEVGDVLVPRVQIVAIEVNTPMETIKDLFLEHGFSRLPVYKGAIDTIIGMIHEKDFYNALVKGEKNIQSIITSMAIATEHMKISVLLRSMQKQKVHMAIVVDEYGGTLGLVTLEDILEELVGEIWDEHDEIIDHFTKVDPNTYLVDGNADLSDFFKLFSLDEDKEEEYDSNTVSGWVIEECGDLPILNYKFDYENLTVEITKRSIKKIMQIKVTINPEETDDDEDD